LIQSPGEAPTEGIDGCLAREVGAMTAAGIEGAVSALELLGCAGIYRHCECPFQSAFVLLSKRI